jgi:hypothetical protein
MQPFFATCEEMISIDKLRPDDALEQDLNHITQGYSAEIIRSSCAVRSSAEKWLDILARLGDSKRK